MKLEQRIEALENKKPDAKLGHWSIPIDRMYGGSEEDFPDVWVDGPYQGIEAFYGKLPE